MTRQELYDAIWSQPISDIARRIGSIPAEVKLACILHEVPLPSDEQFALIEGGRPLKGPRLRKLPACARHLETVRISVEPERSGRHPIPQWTQSTLGVADVGASLSATDNTSPYETPRAQPHILLVRTAEVLRSTEPRKGLVEATVPGCCGIAVRPEDVERAIAFAGDLIWVLTGAGLKVKAGGAFMTVEGLGERLQLRLRDKVRLHKMSQAEADKERSQNPRSPHDRVLHELGVKARRKVLKQEPTGILRLYINGAYAADKFSWHDTPHQPLESRIKDIKNGIVQYLRTKAIKDRLDKAKEAQSQAEKLQSERRQAAKSIELERARFVDQIAADIERSRQLDIVAKHLNYTESEPELRRLAEWIDLWRSALGERLHSNVLEDALKRQNLFPDPGSDIVPMSKRSRYLILRRHLMPDGD